MLLWIFQSNKTSSESIRQIHAKFINIEKIKIYERFQQFYNGKISQDLLQRKVEINHEIWIYCLIFVPGFRRTYYFNNQSMLISIANYISAIFVTYDDYSFFMSQHADDFCFWVDEQYLAGYQFASNHDLKNVLSIIFTEQIAYDVSWSSWLEIDSIATRHRTPKGFIQNFIAFLWIYRFSLKLIKYLC